MNLVVKILIWVIIGVLMWQGLPLLLHYVFGLVGVVVRVVQFLLDVALLVLITGIVVYLYRRVRSA